MTTPTAVVPSLPFISASPLAVPRDRKKNHSCRRAFTIFARQRRSRRKRRPQDDDCNSSQLPPLPGGHKWTVEDSDFWKEIIRQEKAIRGPHIKQFQPENDDNFSDWPPLGAQIGADIRWDSRQQQYVRTTEEERQSFLTESSQIDPFFVPEASPSSSFSSNFLRAQSHAQETVTIHPVHYPVDGSPLRPEDPPVFVPDPNDGGGMTEVRRAYSVHRFPADAPIDNGVDEPAVPPDSERRPLELSPGNWRVVHLGTSSAVPTRRRNVSSTAYLAAPPKSSQDPHMILVDSGEGTSGRLLDCEWCMSHGFRWLRAICVTHLHGDHVYGLPSLLKTIGQVCQHRTRLNEEEIVIPIYGPPGIRAFIRSSLFWTRPVGVKFSIAELRPRVGDFAHVSAYRYDSGANSEGGIVIVKDGVEQEFNDDDIAGVPPPHPEEVRVEDIEASEDGTWKIWGDRNDGDIGFEIVAAPLKHRLACFGYLFRGDRVAARKEEAETHEGNGVVKSLQNGAVHEQNEGAKLEIDMKKARDLGVYGSQYGKLRRGQTVVVAKTGISVTYEDVRLDNSEVKATGEEAENELVVGDRKVLILGDTCDSSAIAGASHGADLVVHEATFASSHKKNALKAMHSTAEMAGEFARGIAAKTLVLTHFSSRYEALGGDGIDSGKDLVRPSRLVVEAEGRTDARVVAAVDFMEHDISRDGTVTTTDRSGNRKAAIRKHHRFRAKSSGQQVYHSQSEEEEIEIEDEEDDDDDDNFEEILEDIEIGGLSMAA